MNLRIALGHQSRVGKDTFAGHISGKYGCNIVSFASGVYDVVNYIQEYLGVAPKKDPKLLQFIGMGLRDHYHANIWVNHAMMQINSIISLDSSANIIVTDMRFPNEMEALKASGFITIKILRRDRVIDRDPNHVSETALAGSEFDYTIANDGTLEDFSEKIDQIIIQITSGK